MSPLAAAAVVVALVAAATLLGVVWRSRQGRVRTTVPAALVRPSDVGVDDGFGTRATLLQFSTEFCAYCPATRRVLGGLADEREGVEHVDIDLTNAPAIAKRFNVLQTPTTLVLDGTGAIRARIGGAPRPRELAERLDHILGETHVAA